MSQYFTIGGRNVAIPLEDLGGDAISESTQEDGTATATVMMQCAWADRYTVYRALKGTTVAVGRSIVRTIPWAYPDSPNLFCLAIGESRGIKPYRDSRGWVGYQIARFPVHFGRPKYDFTPNAPDGQNDPSGQPWTTTKFKVSAEILTPPKGSFHVGPFPSTTKAEEGSVGIIRANVEISMTRHFLPWVPLSALRDTAGFVNLYPIQFADSVFPSGQLLFTGADTTPNTDPAGNFSQEVAYTIMGKDNDWNQFVSADGSLQYLNTRADGSGSYPYPYADFSVLP